MKVTRSFIFRCAFALASSVFTYLWPSDAIADPHWHEAREIHHFRERDLPLWRSGHWYDGWHEGRRGRWWIVDGAWYWYPLTFSIATYPDPFIPAVVTPSAPVLAGSPVQAAPQVPSSWYHCDNPVGYYPYVPECASGWKAVPAIPPK